MEKSANKVEVVTVVAGVVLTPEAIDQLKVMQESDNSYIKDECRILSDVVCFLGFHYDDFTESEKQKAMLIIRELSQTREWVQRLQKP
jgi:hypothetical protein